MNVDEIKDRARLLSQEEKLRFLVGVAGYLSTRISNRVMEKPEKTAFIFANVGPAQDLFSHAQLHEKSELELDAILTELGLPQRWTNYRPVGNSPLD